MNKYTTLGGFILLAVVTLIIGTMIYHSNNAYSTVSTFSLSPTPQVTPTKTPEPIITSWDIYTNDKFNFTISYPQGWNHQEYKGPYGATLIAFSPDDLPCSNCTYIHNGFFSIKIFNQKTDQQAYTDYTASKQQVGRNAQYIPVQLDGKPAVVFENTVALEYNGNVFEFVLDTDNGNDKATDSKIFQKAVLSLHFTNLVFTN